MAKKRINELRREISAGGLHRDAEAAVLVGAQLSEVREEVLASGANWTTWPDEQVGVPLRTANRLIQLYNKFGKRPGRLRGMKISVAYFLLDPRLPETAVNDLLARHAGGEKLTVAGVREVIASYDQDKPAKPKG